MSVEQGHRPPEQGLDTNKSTERPLRTEVAQVPLTLEELAGLGSYTDPERHQETIDNARDDALAQAQESTLPQEIVTPPRLGELHHTLDRHGLPTGNRTTQLVGRAERANPVDQRVQNVIAPEKPAPGTERENTVEAKKDILDIALRTEARSYKWRSTQERHYDAQEKQLKIDIQNGKLLPDSPYAKAIRTNIENWERSSKQTPSEEIAPNQDKMFIDKDRDLFVLADGAGGYKGGERAAQIAIDSFALSPEIKTTDPKKAAAELLTSANVARNKMSAEASEDTSLEEMASTVVAAQIIDGNKLVFIGIGDSMIGVFREGKPIWLTVEQGKGSKIYNALQAGTGNGERAAFGKGSMHEDVSGVFELQPGDRVFMLSDGVLGDKPEDRPDMSEYSKALSMNNTPEEAVDALFEIGTKYDDTSAIVFDFNPVDAELRTFNGHIEDPFKRIKGDLDLDTRQTAPHRALDTIPRVKGGLTDQEVEFYNVASQLRLAAEHGGHYAAEKDRIIADFEKAIFRGVKTNEAGMKEIEDIVDKIDMLMGEKRLHEEVVQDEIENAGSRKDRKWIKAESYFEDQEELNKLVDGILKGRSKLDTLAIKGGLAELSGLPAEAWENHAENLIDDAAAELAKSNPGITQEDQVKNLTAVLDMSNEEWAKEESKLAKLRDDSIPSTTEIQQDLRNRKVFGNDRPVIDDIRFLRYVLESAPDTLGNRPETPEQQKTLEEEESLLRDKLVAYVTARGEMPDSPLYKQIEASARGMLAAKQLGEDRIVDRGPGEARRYREGSVRRQPRNRQAAAIMEDFNAINEAADEFDNNKQQIAALERNGNRLNPRRALRLRRLRKEQARLSSTLAQARLPRTPSLAFFTPRRR